MTEDKMKTQKQLSCIELIEGIEKGDENALKQWQVRKDYEIAHFYFQPKIYNLIIEFVNESKENADIDVGYIISAIELSAVRLIKSHLDYDTEKKLNPNDLVKIIFESVIFHLNQAGIEFNLKSILESINGEK